MRFREWLENQNAYFWASSGSYQPGDIITAGSHPDKTYNPWATAFNGLIDRHRIQNFPDMPSRNGALFLSDDLRDAKNWQRILKAPHLYSVELVRGKMHRTDSHWWGDALHDFSKWGLYSNKSTDQTLDAYHARSHGYANSIRRQMDQYWSGKADEDSDFEMPEIILEKGGQIKILTLV